MLRLTDKEMIEIGRVRERLLAIRNKCQRYPALPVNVPILPATAKVAPPRNAFEQVKAELIFLRNKVAQLQTKRKSKGIY